MTGFTDFISGKKKGGIKEEILVYLTLWHNELNELNVFWKEKNNLHTSIFIEAKKEATDLTYFSQLLTKLSFWNIKTNKQAGGMISWYQKGVEKVESGRQTT